MWWLEKGSSTKNGSRVMILLRFVLSSIHFSHYLLLDLSPMPLSLWKIIMLDADWFPEKPFRKKIYLHYSGMKKLPRTRWFRQISVTRILRGFLIAATLLLILVMKRRPRLVLKQFPSKALVGRLCYRQVLEACSQHSTVKRCMLLWMQRLLLIFCGRAEIYL